MGSIKQAQQFSIAKKRFIVVYIEDNESLDENGYSNDITEEYRRALSDSRFGEMLNEQVHLGNIFDHSFPFLTTATACFVPHPTVACSIYS